MKKRNYITGLVPAIVLSAAYQSPSLLAAESKEVVLEEIVVTSQRREQSLQQVPIAVSALSKLSIEKADISDLTDIATRVPGLTFSPFSPGQNILALRGASSNDDGAGTDNSIAVFVDDVYLGRASNVNPELFDLERIEVLRGPQGTLYGKNTIGGAINIVSTRPNTEEFEGKIRANFGNFDRRDLAGLISGPLTENLAGKLSISTRKRDGWVDNLVLNKKQKDDDSQSVRGQLLFTNDNFEALFSGDFNKLDVEDMARIPINTGDPRDPALWFNGSYTDLCGTNSDPSCAAGAVDGFTKQESWGLSSRLTWDIGDGELISVTAYRENESDWNMDSTGGTSLILVDDILDNTEQFSQEIRWVSSVGDEFNYVAGLWYLQEETDRSECFDLSPESDCTPDADGGATDFYRQVNETTGYAVFGQFDWNFAENLTLTMGARYSYEEKEIENDAIAGNFVIINQIFNNMVSEDWSAFTPKVSLAYQATDSINIFGTIAKGFKSGGFAAAPQDEKFTDPLDQEEALNYEFGVKSDVTDQLRANLAVFYTEYEDLQIQTFGPLTAGSAFGTFQTFNSGDAEIFGVELEMTWVASNNLTISGFYGYQDSEFGNTNIAGIAFSDQFGQDLIRTPKNKYSINADYIYPLGNNGEIAANISYRYTDDQRGELEPWAIQPEFDLVDARIGWTRNDDKLEVALWAKNLADEEYITHLYTIASSVVAVFGDPRMFGVSVTYKH